MSAQSEIHRIIIGLANRSARHSHDWKYRISSNLGFGVQGGGVSESLHIGNKIVACLERGDWKFSVDPVAMLGDRLEIVSSSMRSLLSDPHVAQTCSYREADGETEVVVPFRAWIDYPESDMAKSGITVDLVMKHDSKGHLQLTRIEVDARPAIQSAFEDDTETA